MYRETYLTVEEASGSEPAPISSIKHSMADSTIRESSGHIPVKYHVLHYCKIHEFSDT